MAGSYADVPGRRFAIHLDGTSMIYHQFSGSFTNEDSYLANVSDNSNTTHFAFGYNGTTVGNYIAFIFPELRNLDGYYMSVNSLGWMTADQIEVSVDTTDGVGGTWTQVSATWQNSSTEPSDWRNIVPLAASNIKAIRFRFRFSDNNAGTKYLRNIHFYGSIVNGQTPNRLCAWDPTIDQEVSGSYFDFGDMAQGTQQTKTFRIKNISTSMTATGVSLSHDDILDNGMGLTFSNDGTTFTSPLSLGDIAPGATTGGLHVRRSVGAAETVLLRGSMIKAIPASWS